MRSTSYITFAFRPPGERGELFQLPRNTKLTAAGSACHDVTTEPVRYWWNVAGETPA